jgi:hypothetical protein
LISPKKLSTRYVAIHTTASEIALLGQVPAEEIARQTGRTVHAVQQKLEALGRSKPGW